MKLHDVFTSREIENFLRQKERTAIAFYAAKKEQQEHMKMKTFKVKDSQGHIIAVRASSVRRDNSVITFYSGRKVIAQFNYFQWWMEE